MNRAAVGIMGAALSTMLVVVVAPPGAAAQCCGDCNGDGQVTIDEIVKAVNRALEVCQDDGVCTASVASCNTNLATCTASLTTCNAGTAAPGDVLSGKTFSSSAGIGVTGSMPNNGAVVLTPGTSNQTLPAGYHNGSGYCAGDANLVSGNIKNGATIFGVSGNLNVVNTSGATATATNIVSGQTCYANGSLVTGSATAGSNVSGGNGLKTFTIPDGLYSGSKTATANDTNLVAGNIRSGVALFGGTGTLGLPSSGQTTSYGAGSDGDVQAGAALAYTDNGDGTVTDNNTGLMWEKKDNSGGIHGMNNTYTWGMTTAPYSMNGTMVTTFLGTLNSPPCFASHCDWRIPNVKELQSIVDYEIPFPGPAVNTAFHNVAGCTGCTDVTMATCSCTNNSTFHWSSTTVRNTVEAGIGWFNAWAVAFSNGFQQDLDAKSIGHAVRAVRGGL